MIVLIFKDGMRMVVRWLEGGGSRSKGATPRGACIAVSFIGRFFWPVPVLSGAFIRTFTLSKDIPLELSLQLRMRGFDSLEAPCPT